MPEKPILAFDCATPAASVALRTGGHIHARTIEHGRQASELVSTIDTLLREHNVSYAGLGAIVTTVGPGSFTGLRIALATLHGLVLAHATPVKTLTSLEAVAWDIAQRKGAPAAFTVALNAGKGEMFYQHFILKADAPYSRGTIAMVSSEQVPATFPTFGNTQGEGSAQYINGPSASVLCVIEGRLAATHIADALPLYIRAPDAKVPQPFAWFSEEVS